jgi:hypothetical protein
LIYESPLLLAIAALNRLFSIQWAVSVTSTPIMHLLSVSLLVVLCGATIANAVEKKVEGEENDSDTVKPTVFNGVKVPPMIQIVGQDFNTTVKDGWWFVKHHSYVTEFRPKSILLTTTQPLVPPLPSYCPSIPNSLRILLHFQTHFQ